MGQKRKKIKDHPALAAMAALCGNRKLAQKILRCLFDHGYHIAPNKKHTPIKPVGKAS